MKRNLKKVLVLVLLTIVPLIMLAQSPPHPNGGSNPGPGNGPVGGGADIGGGFSILLAMGAAFGFNKLYQKKRDNSIIE